MCACVAGGHLNVGKCECAWVSVSMFACVCLCEINILVRFRTAYMSA